METMKKMIIETGDGFVGLSWTKTGIAVLNFPAPTVYDAEIELKANMESLSKCPGEEKAGTGGEINPAMLEREIRSYFAGNKVDLSFPVDFGCYTEFQARVLREVYAVPWGSVVSYGQIAARAGNPRAARAVGGAVGSNRVPIVVPCHRIIAGDGTIGGFSGGLDRKRRLLGLEGIYL